MRTLRCTLRCSLLMLLALAPQASATPRSTARRAPDASGRAARMVMIPAGTYRPLYAAAGTARVAVSAFALDRAQVTRRQYLAFVTSRPEWRPGTVSAALADERYLSDWAAPLDAGSSISLDRPVTSVSWFAAKAYCAAQGTRLPTVDEWEYVAAASETVRDASASPAFRNRLLALYSSRHAAPRAPRGFVNVYGVRGLHDLVWEWTHDFKSVVGGQSHAKGGTGHAHQHDLYCASSAIGATDPANYPAFMRYAVRSGLDARSTTRGLGFRCAADAPLR